tara:strand:+ start:307 stop:1524 length:1218 start_codon:yes stop_codon:yes gene_type:complete
MNKVCIPKLRFSGFEREWEKAKLSEKMDIFRGASPRPKGDPKYYGGTIPRLMIQDATRDGKYTIPKIDFLTDEGALKSRLLKKGSVVLSCSGTRVAIPTMLGVDACIHDGWLAFRDYKDVHEEFLYNLFVKLHERMQGEATTGGVFNNLTTSILKDLKMGFPSFKEQQKIATFLSSVDEKIQQLSRKKELLEQYKKGVMQQLFSRKMQFKDENGKDYADWEEKKLGEVCDVRDGTHDSPKYVEKGFPFITSKNLMKDGSIDFENITFINEVDYNKVNQRSKVNINDILFGMIGTIGNPVIVRSEGFAIKNVALIKEKKDLLNLFLIHFLKGDSINQQFFQQNTGGTQKFLSLSVIRNLMVIIPSLPEQQKIAIFLSGIDTKIENVGQEINNMQGFKKGLLQQMFV